jgi:hypothetical protein
MVGLAITHSPSLGPALPPPRSHLYGGPMPELKPTDFFLGLVDFFAILLPGAILCYLLLPLYRTYLAPDLEPLNDPAMAWVAFGIASYAAGHLLHQLGGYVDALVYDTMYVDGWKRSKGPEKLLQQVRSLLGEPADDTNEEKAQRWPSVFSWAFFVRLGKTCYSQLILRPYYWFTGKGAPPQTGLQRANTFSWASAFVRLRNAAAAAELERAGVDSKFFRSLALVALVAACGAVYQGRPWLAAAAVALAGFSLMRYCERRWKAAQLTYQYAILLRTSPLAKGEGPGPESTPASEGRTMGEGRDLVTRPPIGRPVTYSIDSLHPDRLSCDNCGQLLGVVPLDDGEDPAQLVNLTEDEVYHRWPKLADDVRNHSLRCARRCEPGLEESEQQEHRG